MMDRIKEKLLRAWFWVRVLWEEAKEFFTRRR